MAWRFPSRARTRPSCEPVTGTDSLRRASDKCSLGTRREPETHDEAANRAHRKGGGSGQVASQGSSLLSVCGWSCSHDDLLGSATGSLSSGVESRTDVRGNPPTPDKSLRCGVSSWSDSPKRDQSPLWRTEPHREAGRLEEAHLAAVREHPDRGTRSSADQLFPGGGSPARNRRREIDDVPNVVEPVIAGFGYAFLAPSTVADARRPTLRRVRLRSVVMRRFDRRKIEA